MREDGPEPIIVQIKESFRLSDDLDSHLEEVETSERQSGLEVVKRWAGSKLLVLLSFPSGFKHEQALAAIERLQQLPGVEKVVPVSAFNLHFRSGDLAREYGSGETIPEAARRGLDTDQFNRRPARHWSQASLDHTPHVPYRVIVRWKDEHVWRADVTGFEQVMADLHHETGCHVVREIRYSPSQLIQVLKFDDGDTLADKLNRYVDSGLVVYAQPAFIYKTLTGASDPWYLGPPGPQWSLPIISAPQAWNMTIGNPSVIIAVADSGANVLHPDFITNLWSGQNNGDIHNFIYQTQNVDDDLNCPDFCAFNHGSAVAAIAGAQGGNGIFMTGVARETALMILKVVDSAGHSNTDVVAEAIEYAANHGATAINLSLGFYTAECNPDGKGGWDCIEVQYDDVLVDAMVYAQNHNMVIVSAAGNGAAYRFPDGSDPSDNDVNLNRIMPASIPTRNNISVLATQRNDIRAPYSSYGKYRVDLAAPGGTAGDQIPGLSQDFSDPNYSNKVYGTSAAAPHVAGALALVKSFFPWEDYAGIRDRILMATDPIPGVTPGVEGKCRTNGRLNISKALQPRSMLRNLSTRARVEGGDRVMIAGFIIGGSATGGSIDVVMRGLGPSLAPGITNHLVDPVIELHKPDNTVETNDNWQTDPRQADLIASGLQPSNPTEAAMIRTLAPGAYTVIVSGHGSPSDYGVGLVELYALGNSQQSRLQNISTRCLVGTGDNVAIAGTIIASATGNTTGGTVGGEVDGEPDSVSARPDRRLLIFGKGPSLGTFTMAPSGYLNNPTLQIAGGASNDNWTTLDDDSGDGTALEEILDQAGFAPASSSESALWPTFRPGAQTVILSGVNQSTGIGLIEFYEY